jgi:AbrB family looped-hinge helix DNA binding protein
MPPKRHSKRLPSLKAPAQRVLMGRQGRVVIPAPLRRALGVKAGEEFLVEIEEGHLVMRRYDELDEKLWAKFKHLKGSMAEELLRERRAEAGREAKP